MARIGDTQGGYMAAQPAEAEQEQSVEYTPSTWERIRAFLTGPWPTLVSRFVLGVVFLLAGLTKVGVPEALTQSINSYEMPLPSALVQVMSVGLPYIELLIGVWLLIGLFTRFSAAVAGVLVLIFLVGLIQAMFRGLTPNCGCFGGPTSNPLGSQVMDALGPVGYFLTHETVGIDTVVRDLVFLAMSVHLIIVPTTFSIDSWRRNRYAQEDEAYEEGEEEVAGEEIDSAPAQ